MDPVTGLSLGRIVVGAIALADPRLAGRLLNLDTAANPQLPYVARLFGSREIALGAATLLARGSTRRNLVLLGTFVDAADAGTGYLGIQDETVPQRAAAPFMAVATGAVVAGLLGLRRTTASPS